MNGMMLTERRIQLGMTKSELARALVVPYQTVDRWESGAMRIRHPRILALALDSLEREQDDGGEVGVEFVPWSNEMALAQFMATRRGTAHEHDNAD